MLALFPSMNYKPWYAIAEFVDNSLQSFLSNRAAIEKLHGKEAKLRVDIELDATPPGRIVVRDNAAGIVLTAWLWPFGTPARWHDNGPLAAVVFLLQSLVVTLHSTRGSYFHSLAAFLPFGVALGTEMPALKRTLSALAKAGIIGATKG